MSKEEKPDSCLADENPGDSSSQVADDLEEYVPESKKTTSQQQESGDLATEPAPAASVDSQPAKDASANNIKPASTDSQPVNNIITSSEATANENQSVTGSVNLNSNANENQSATANVNLNNANATDVPNAAATSARTETEAAPVDVYHVKYITFDGCRVPIVTQSVDGPCPLLAIANTLLLRRKITLAAHTEMVSAAQLLQLLGEVILSSKPEDFLGDEMLNYEHNLSDAMDVLHKLQNGLVVNVRFSAVHEFEYTQDLIVFDLLNINLVHGWLIEPGSDEAEVVGRRAYNQLVDLIITHTSSEDEEKRTQSLLAQNFLDRTASQLTYHGLCELNSHLRHQQIAVFFRNNHFNTLYKHHDDLLLLVTDSGFLLEPSTVWEKLTDAEGGSVLLDDQFRPFTASSQRPTPGPNPYQPPGQHPAHYPQPHQQDAAPQTDADYMMALKLQHEDRERSEVADRGNRRNVSDLELARQLQEEEQRRVGHRQRPATSPAAPPASRGKDGCTIL